MGWVNICEYWMKAVTSPNESAPAAMRSPPTMAMATYCRFPTNIIMGMMIPEMNWALKLDWKSSSFCSSKSSMLSFWRPKILTMVWPVKVSSTCPVREPVLCHCRVNCFCERLAMTMVTATEIGTVIRAMRASSQLT